MKAQDTRPGGRHAMRERLSAPGPPVRPACAPIWEILGFDSLQQALKCWRFQMSAPYGATPEGYREAA